MTKWLWACARSFLCASDFGLSSSFGIRHASFTPVRLHRVNFGGGTRRQVAGRESHSPRKQTDQTERQWVGRSDSEKQARPETRACLRGAIGTVAERTPGDTRAN